MSKTAAVRSQARRAALTKAAAEAAFADGFCKAAETLGVDPGALVKAAKLSVGNAAKFLNNLGRTSSGAMVPRIDRAVARIERLGKASPGVLENLTQMRGLASGVDRYAADFLGKPIYPGAALKGKTLFSHLVDSVAGRDSTGIMDARQLLRQAGYLK